MEGNKTDYTELVKKEKYSTVVKQHSVGRLALWASGLVAMVVVTWCVVARGPRPAQAGRAGPALVCYYDSSGAGPAPALVPPALCTHLNVAFAKVLNKTVHLEPHQYTVLRELVALKRENPALKVLLSIGGAGEKNGFSEMVADHASRKLFIKSVKLILKSLSLDGIDLDWEFPVLHSRKLGLMTRERQHFSQLLREIRMEYLREKKEYILSVAIAAPQVIADVAYDVDQINMYVDYANIMTYDFHYYSKFTPFTGLNSPLYARSSEELFLATLNINYTVQMYLSKGLDRDKIVVGIPTYGHSFKLVNPENTAVGSPACGFGAVGGGGFADYPAVCAAARAPHARAHWDAQARAPFLSLAAEWISHENARSVAEKAGFVHARSLRGAMLYSLNADDHRGECGAGAFPLARAAALALRPPQASGSSPCRR